MHELAEGKPLVGRIRRPGAGRKSITASDPELVQTLEKLGRDVEYQHIPAFFGHDSFLVEVEHMTRLVGGYLERKSKQFGISQ